MVVFVDLEHDALNQNHFVANPHSLLHSFSGATKLEVDSDHPSAAAEPTDRSLESLQSPAVADQPAPKQSSFATALSCYPIAKEIARAVDMDTLHALSHTCRQFHANLIPYRKQLSKMTLRCENEYIEMPSSTASVTYPGSRLTRGKVGLCAWDMVDACIRCAKVVCRNCIAKPATSSMFKNRIRRLCPTCRTAPLPTLLGPQPSCFTRSVFQRNVCTCKSAVWLCHPCGQLLRSSDTSYRRVWYWRSRYTMPRGMLGVGAGEGFQGVKCGRGEHCLAAQDVELEEECESHESRSGTLVPRRGGGPSGPHEDAGPGYLRQEIIGIGGHVKHKVKTRLKVGASVVEHDGEREAGEYLAREDAGLDRAWCGWCDGVVPSQEDLDVLQ